MSWLNESNYGNNTCSKSENVVVVEAFKKMQILGMKLGFAPKWMQNPISLPIILVCKTFNPLLLISIPIGPSNHETLWITLICKQNLTLN
jgi:hypothetical protein